MICFIWLIITNKPAQLIYATIYGYTHTFHEKYFKNSRNAHNFIADEDEIFSWTVFHSEILSWTVFIREILPEGGDKISWTRTLFHNEILSWTEFHYEKKTAFQKTEWWHFFYDKTINHAIDILIYFYNHIFYSFFFCS